MSNELDAKEDDVGPITEALHAVRDAQSNDLDLVLRLSYADMLKVVRAEKRRISFGPATLDTEGLLHESIERLLGPDKTFSFENRRHLFRTVAKISRNILIDHARQRNAIKRGSGERAAALEDVNDPDLHSSATAERLQTALYVDQLINQLSCESPEIAELIELRFFLDLTETEAAEVLGISPRTVQRHWRKGRELLRTITGESEHNI